MRKKDWWCLSVGGVVFILDRFLKSQFLSQDLNRVISFSLPYPSYLLNGSLVVVWLIIFLFFYRRPEAAKGAILIGGLSNILDRFMWGGVVDYIRLGIINLNLADLLISGGVLWWLVKKVS